MIQLRGTTQRHAEIELLMLPPDPDAPKHYAALAEATGAEPGKTCEHCGNQYARTPDESQQHWRTRRYCGRSCAGKAARAKQVQAARNQRIEDVEWIIGTDSPESVARRLGYANADNLSRLLYRWGRPDLGAILATRAVA